jgi:hypothetical protein
MAKYKALIMHSNYDKTKFPCENLELINLGFFMSHAHVGCKIARYTYVVHIFSLVDGSWIKGDEDSFKRFIIEVKNSCVEVAHTLLKKLLKQFFEHEIMMSLGFVYP